MSWPTTDDPRTEFVTVRFTADEAADIAWLQGITNAKSRSATVRQCVDRVVAAEKRAAKRQKTADD
jgi:mevalonate pyrophosphate decarboxylase